MLTGELRSQFDAIWNSFWSGGISHPMEVLEQITYLLFMRRLDDLHTLEENKAIRLGRPIENRVFPFLRSLGGEAGANGQGSSYAVHMANARFTIPTPALLAKAVDLLDAVPMEDHHTKGDLYEYMLGKIASAGQNGQFRTPRHIIRLMVELTQPTARDVICDPAAACVG